MEDVFVPFEDSDILNFSTDVQISDAPPVELDTWKILIVDDEEAVHHVTRLVLSKFEFHGKKIAFYSAHTEAQAKQILTDVPDLAVVLLDVVMSRDDTGLSLANFIRNELQNQLIRIVLRTGQPGQAPEKQVVLQYDINDYKLKTELTADKLFVTMITALRSYEDLTRIRRSESGLGKIVEFSTSMSPTSTKTNFIDGFLSAVIEILSVDKNNGPQSISDVFVLDISHGYKLLKASGCFSTCIGEDCFQRVDEETAHTLKAAARNGLCVFWEDAMAIPIQRGDTTVYICYIRLLKAMMPWERRLIEILAAVLRYGAGNYAVNEELESTQKDILFTLGEIAEARSKETGNHVKRMAAYAKLLAIRSGIDEETAQLIWLAAPVHDLGKLTIPDALLHKPGKLSAEEFDLMQTHSRSGYDILSSSQRNLLKAAAIIAHEHHERYDGTGYPRGLAGEEIHIFGRITAIADVFDALASRRAYKEPWSFEDIVQYIIHERGKHFDPKLVDVFQNTLPEFREIYESMKD